VLKKKPILIGKAMRLIWPEREPVVNEGAAICGVKYALGPGLQDKLREMTQVSLREAAESFRKLSQVFV
jgi:hypothetical protein